MSTRWCNLRCREPPSINPTVGVPQHHIQWNKKKIASFCYWSQLNNKATSFSFATYIFQQMTETAMGAAFSPTIANIDIFMPVFIRKILGTQPLLLKHYIDDIFLIWTRTQDRSNFLWDLNYFHPSTLHTSLHKYVSRLLRHHNLQDHRI